MRKLLDRFLASILTTFDLIIVFSVSNSCLIKVDSIHYSTLVENFLNHFKAGYS